MSRTDLLPENSLFDQLDKAQADLDYLKNAQFSGGDVNRIYALESAAAYDIFLPAVAPQTWASWFFQFNFAHMDFGYAVIDFEIYKTSVAPANLLRVGDVGARDVQSSTFPPTSDFPRLVGFQGGAFNDDTVAHDYYFKLYYLTMDYFTA